MLSAFWYIMLLFSVLAAFTLMGEGETKAGWRILGIFTVLLVIFDFTFNSS